MYYIQYCLLIIAKSIKPMQIVKSIRIDPAFQPAHNINFKSSLTLLFTCLCLCIKGNQAFNLQEHQGKGNQAVTELNAKGRTSEDGKRWNNGQDQANNQQRRLYVQQSQQQLKIQGFTEGPISKSQALMDSIFISNGGNYLSNPYSIPYYSTSSIYLPYSIKTYVPVAVPVSTPVPVPVAVPTPVPVAIPVAVPTPVPIAVPTPVPVPVPVQPVIQLPNNQYTNDLLYGMFLRNYFYGNGNPNANANPSVPTNQIVKINDPNNPGSVITIDPNEVFQRVFVDAQNNIRTTVNSNGNGSTTTGADSNIGASTSNNNSPSSTASTATSTTNVTPQFPSFKSFPQPSNLPITPNPSSSSPTTTSASGSALPNPTSTTPISQTTQPQNPQPQSNPTRSFATSTSTNLNTIPISPASSISLPLINSSYSQYLARYKPTILKSSISSLQTPPSSIESYVYRQKVYLNNIQIINDFNSLNQSLRSWTMGLNKFTDFGQKQIEKTVFAINGVTVRFLQNARQNTVKNNAKTAFPNIVVDWTCLADKEVYNEQACFASHVISATEAVYITTRIYGKSMAPLSIQEIISCGNQKTINGCSGGFYSDVYDYIKKFGVGPSSSYPLQLKTFTDAVVPGCIKSITGSNQYSKSKSFIKDSKLIKYEDCIQVIYQLQFRALTVSISSKNLQFYSTGTFTVSPPDNNTVDHQLTLVGYELGRRFLVKNSWGKDWGMQGYAFVHEQTGLCRYAMYPIVDNQEKIVDQCNNGNGNGN